MEIFQVNRADKRRIKHMVARVMKKDKEPESQSGNEPSLWIESIKHNNFYWSICRSVTGFVWSGAGRTSHGNQSGPKKPSNKLKSNFGNLFLFNQYNDKFAF